jgi:hypothetical protein
MAFGKKPMSVFVRAKLVDEKNDRIVRRTEEKMLAPRPPGTPLGDIDLVDATEDVMMGKDKACARCGKVRGDVSTALSGVCATCHEKERE